MRILQLKYQTSYFYLKLVKFLMSYNICRLPTQLPLNGLVWSFSCCNACWGKYVMFHLDSSSDTVQTALSQHLFCLQGRYKNRVSKTGWGKNSEQYYTIVKLLSECLEVSWGSSVTSFLQQDSNGHRPEYSVETPQGHIFLIRSLSFAIFSCIQLIFSFHQFSFLG